MIVGMRLNASVQLLNSMLLHMAIQKAFQHALRKYRSNTITDTWEGASRGIAALVIKTDVLREEGRDKRKGRGREDGGRERERVGLRERERERVWVWERVGLREGDEGEGGGRDDGEGDDREGDKGRRWGRGDQGGRRGKKTREREMRERERVEKYN